jgi:hypothetical protein
MSEKILMGFLASSGTGHILYGFELQVGYSVGFRPADRIVSMSCGSLDRSTLGGIADVYPTLPVHRFFYRRSVYGFGI